MTPSKILNILLSYSHIFARIQYNILYDTFLVIEGIQTFNEKVPLLKGEGEPFLKEPMNALNRKIYLEMYNFLFKTDILQTKK